MWLASTSFFQNPNLPQKVNNIPQFGEKERKSGSKHTQLRKHWSDWNYVFATQRNGDIEFSLSLVTGSHISCTLILWAKICTCHSHEGCLLHYCLKYFKKVETDFSSYVYMFVHIWPDGILWNIVD